MALVKCPECGSEVSEKALMCPRCGYGLEITLSPGIYTEKERRKSKRIKKNIMLKINHELGLLSDISGDGIRLSTTKVPTNPNVQIKLKIDEHTFDLKGIIRWQKKKPSFSNMKEIGVSIEDAPEEYYRLLDELYQNESSNLQDEIDEEEESSLDKFFQ